MVVPCIADVAICTTSRGEARRPRSSIPMIPRGPLLVAQCGAAPPPQSPLSRPIVGSYSPLHHRGHCQTPLSSRCSLLPRLGEHRQRILLIWPCSVLI